jgi:hypothetical protein
MSPSFASLTTRSLAFAGDNDVSPLSTRGADWFTDVYKLSPGVKALVNYSGGEHMLGGITGYGVSETTDESPERVQSVGLLSVAFIKSVLLNAPNLWTEAVSEFNKSRKDLGSITTK